MSTERYRNTMSGDVLHSWAAGAQIGIDRLTRELAEAKARAIDWISHPETIEAKRQWDAVAEALGADKDCPDSVLKAAKARALPDGWVAVPVEPTEEMIRKSAGVCLNQDLQQMQNEHAVQIYRAMLAARPDPKESSDVE